jgi:hypothetical protein
MSAYEDNPRFKRTPTDVELLKSLKYCGVVDQDKMTQLEKLLEMGESLRAILRKSDLLSEQQLESQELGTRFVNADLISMPEFVIAMYDERTQGIRLRDSLQERGLMPD